LAALVVHGMMRRVLLLLLVFLLWGSGPGAAAAGAEEGPAARAAKQYRLAWSMYQTLEAAGDDGAGQWRWQACLGMARRAYLEGPRQSSAPAALLLMGRINRQLGRAGGDVTFFREAAGYFADVARLFPGDRLADDCLFLLAELYLRDQGERHLAIDTLTGLVQRFPDGDMARPARRLLAELAGQPRPVSPVSPAADDIAAAGGIAEVSGSARLLPISHWSSDNYTRVVIKADRPVSFRPELRPADGAGPQRLLIDLAGCRRGPEAGQPLAIGDGLLRRVRSGQFAADTVRVELELEAMEQYKIFTLLDPFRLVIDLKGRGGGPAAAAAVIGSVDSPSFSLARQLGLGVRRIVIDPGHGGKDPGAIGANGLREKEVVLAVALKLAAILRRELGCEVFLTRETDLFLPLEERTAIANTLGGDLFVSVHANAAPSPATAGVETYFLDLTDDRDAMRLAAFENATSAGAMSDLRNILAELLQNSKKEESARLAASVQGRMAEGLGLRDHGVKQAPFYVLVGARMPAILAEIAFLSNPGEARRLQSDAFRDAVAERLAAGVIGYVNGNATAASLSDR